MNMTKCCGKCHRVLPLDSFTARTKTLADGTLSPYRLGQCRLCLNAADAERKRRQRGNGGPAPRHVEIPAAPSPVLATRIANRAEQSRIAVFRKRGRLAWCDASHPLPSDADVLGYYDHGADVRAIRRDLECAA